MNHLPQAWGRVSGLRNPFHEMLLTALQPRDDVYGAYDGSYLQSHGPNQHTQQPIVTGTSVIALKFQDGVVIAADNLGT
jgi:20S proteasome subunit beta 7